MKTNFQNRFQTLISDLHAITAGTNRWACLFRNTRCRFEYLLREVPFELHDLDPLSSSTDVDTILRSLQDIEDSYLSLTEAMAQLMNIENSSRPGQITSTSDPTHSRLL